MNHTWLHTTNCWLLYENDLLSGTVYLQHQHILAGGMAKQGLSDVPRRKPVPRNVRSWRSCEVCLRRAEEVSYGVRVG